MSNTCDETKCNGDCSSCGGDGVTVTLTLDDDSTVECAIVGIFDAGEKEYIALLPLEEDGKNHNGEVYLYKFSRTENGDPIMDNIEDDDEYTAAAEKFDEILTNARKAEMANAPLED